MTNLLNKNTIFVLGILYITYLATSSYISKPNTYISTSCDANTTLNYTKYNFTEVCECTSVVNNIYVYIFLECVLGIFATIYVLIIFVFNDNTHSYSSLKCLGLFLFCYLTINITFGSIYIVSLFSNNCNNIISYYDNTFYYDFLFIYIHILIITLFLLLEYVNQRHKEEYTTIQNSDDVVLPPPYEL